MLQLKVGVVFCGLVRVGVVFVSLCCIWFGSFDFVWLVVWFGLVKQEMLSSLVPEIQRTTLGHVVLRLKVGVVFCCRIWVGLVCFGLLWLGWAGSGGDN